MTYRPLALPRDLHGDVAAVVREALEPRLRDVRAMLRLPLRRAGIAAGCNFTIVESLLSTIGGVSTVLYPRDKKGDGEQFETCVREYYPTDEEVPAPRIERPELATELWKKVRNPMAHCLGLAMEKDWNTKGRVAADWGHGIKIARDRAPLSAREVDAIEGDEWPKFLTRPTAEWSDGFLKLSCEAFYRGTRRMIERILREREEMQAAAQRLRDLGITGPEQQTMSGPNITYVTTGPLSGMGPLDKK